jgi:signal transduction histidine kinase
VRAVHEPFPFWSATTMTLAGWTLGAAGAGAGILARAQYVALIEERAQREAEAQEAGARHRSAEERLRIARDLHDALGHNVAVIRLHAGLARRALRTDPDQAEAALRETESAAKSVLQELAGVLRLLRETGQDQQPAPVPGLGDIDAVVAALRAGGMTVTVDREGDPAWVSAVAGMTAYRVVQESLTNARRHGAGPVSLSVRVEPECLVVRTANAVLAADRPATSGFGLLGMRERVRAVGGDLDVTATDTSFVVTARIPVAAADGAGAGGMMER